jgi:ABC-2 type transport system ATP-binding protein
MTLRRQTTGPSVPTGPTATTAAAPAAVLATHGLGRRYGRRWALRDCTLAIPEGRIVGLVGANGAGKTTLLHLAAGLREPSSGTITVLGERPGANATQLARVGFLAQDAPVYGGMTVADHLRLGDRLNLRWDAALASARAERLGLDPGQRAGRLSTGQRTQLALTLALGKCPDLLILDEPAASLDPLARRALLSDLMEHVADRRPTVVLSSHLLADVERVCDHLVILAGGRVRLAADVDDLLATHRVLTGPRLDTTAIRRDHEVVTMSHTDRQTTMVVRTTGPVLDPRWAVSDVGLEELALAYMSAADTPAPRPDLVAVRP